MNTEPPGVRWRQATDEDLKVLAEEQARLLNKIRNTWVANIDIKECSRHVDPLRLIRAAREMGFDIRIERGQTPCTAGRLVYYKWTGLWLGKKELLERKAAKAKRQRLITAAPVMFEALLEYNLFGETDEFKQLAMQGMQIAGGYKK